jgi:hypothetical protein
MTRSGRNLRKRMAGTLGVAVLLATFMAGMPTASAAAFSGGISPTIYSGGADLNGDGVVNGRDDSNMFFGDTSIIDGKLDCNAWGATKNAGTAGSLVIDSSDDCSLLAYDGTATGVTIAVTDGVFTWPTGTALPTVYPKVTDPSNPGVAAADFAWSTIGGKVDSNGDETIDGTDCTFGLIGQTVDAGLGSATDGADVLGSDAGCGFAGTILATLNGLVDLNSDETITAGGDSCTNGCFFGHNVTTGVVQAAAGAPTITSFAPTSGAVGTSVVITGTNFSGATSVTFNGTSASFTVDSGTQITATVPTGATTGKIAVTTPSGTVTSSTNFTVTGTATITSFTPTFGPIGTTVTITGTNFTGATAVKFNGVTATFTVNSATQITATVPTGATTGKITVTTPSGTATSATDFTVTGPSHARGISLRLSDALVARGKVTVSDGFAACTDSVPVKVQKRVSGHWKTVKNATTSSTGAYRVHLGNKHGRYRSLAPRVIAGTDTCSRAVSQTRTH